MPVIEAQCASILVPHDHRHINQMRSTGAADSLEHGMWNRRDVTEHLFSRASDDDLGRAQDVQIGGYRASVLCRPSQTRDRGSRHRAVRDAATTQIAVTADQDSVRTAKVTVLIRRPNRAHGTLPLHRQITRIANTLDDVRLEAAAPDSRWARSLSGPGLARSQAVCVVTVLLQTSLDGTPRPCTSEAGRLA